MNNRIVFSVFFLVVILFIGCKKHIDDNDLINDEVTDEVKVGDYNNMIINHYDTTITGEFMQKTGVRLDINNDGIDDLMFVPSLWGSMGVGYHHRSEIFCLNKDVELYGFPSFDTTFMNIEITIKSNPNGTFQKDHYIRVSCQRYNDKDSVKKISPLFKIITLIEGEVLEKEANYKSDTIKLIESNFQYPKNVYTSGDTNVTYLQTVVSDCYNLPLKKDIYIGFRIAGKLGWVKINLPKGNIITIHESAVQK